MAVTLVEVVDAIVDIVAISGDDIGDKIVGSVLVPELVIGEETVDIVAVTGVEVFDWIVNVAAVS